MCKGDFDVFGTLSLGDRRVGRLRTGGFQILGSLSLGEYRAP